MAVNFVKVYYTPQGGVEEDITEYSVLQQKRGLDIKDAKVDIRLDSSRYRYKTGGESIFTQDGDIDVYVDNSPITRTSSQLLISGQIQTITHSVGENGAQTSFSVADKTNLLLSGLWGFTYVGETVDSIIRSVINNAPSASGQVTTTNVVSTMTTGSAFPLTDMAKVQKPIYEWLTDLSQPSVTGEDKAMLFYVDKDNDLHWFYPSSTASGSIIEGTDEIHSVSMRKSQDELVNMVIYNAGQDLVGNGNLWYYYDTTSKSNKMRMKFQPMIEIGRDLFRSEIDSGNLQTSSGGAFHYQGKDYGASYPITPDWEGATSVSNDSDYNDAFRERQRAIAQRRAQAFTAAFSGLKWKGNLMIRGTTGYTAGDLLSVTLPSVGMTNQKLRVWDVQHTLGSDAWTTTLELREDDTAISEA